MGPRSSAEHDSGLSDDGDPLLLASRLQSDEQIQQLHQRKKRRRLGRVIGEFYEKQNKQIGALLMTMDQHIEHAHEEQATTRLSVKIAIYGSLVANCVLGILQMYAAISSLSMSIVVTAMDAVFDPLANLVLNYCHRKAATADLRRFPSGGRRLETVGDVVYASIMLSVSVVLIAFSCQDLVRGSTGNETLHIPSLVVVGIAFAKIFWWIDPLGALIISLALVIVWARTLYQHYLLLAGVAAPIESQQLVIYKAMMYADGIKQIDSCTGGPDYIVELDIVMDGDTPLWKAHDLSEALQDKIEQLPNVGRAFVHVDHDSSHKLEHQKIK
ncbi:hypothetical protein DFH06DRAFT_1425356 [Mycena polygramma]|nr:hypothetical protein DFH06DRAFT_1425356 [Mycena polygramma]